MPRSRTARFQCSHPGCREFAYYTFQYKDEGVRIYADNGNGKYKCTRHNHPDTVLGFDRRKIVAESTSTENVPGHLFWGHSGFASGPGFCAWADDFPKGTVLRVTAEIVLPPDTDEAGAEPSSASHP